MKIELQALREAAPSHFLWSARLVEEHREMLGVMDDVVLPPHLSQVRGCYVSVIDGAGEGFAATSNLSRSGFARAFEMAAERAAAAKTCSTVNAASVHQHVATGIYDNPPALLPSHVPLVEKLNLLRKACSNMAIDDKIVFKSARLAYRKTVSHFVNSDGADIAQTTYVTAPYLSVSASDGSQTQGRSLSDRVRQGGMELLDDIGFLAIAEQLSAQSLELLSAPNCPAGDMDIILMPDQMALQIHESIGHPLELDRILGDERNYAGTSFVTADMFGSYRYGSKHLNITFSPEVAGEVASYSHDDEGSPAEEAFLIKNGLLERPLGSVSSQARANLHGVANARASSWNRPPIDRMANLNLEPGEASMSDLISGVEHGVVMTTNKSWSIDDSRNKFQFGCEYGRMIENGELTHVVRNPNYRGISSKFWRNLAGVGDQNSVQIHGVGNCGKGEPNQAVAVGHASPPCLFRQVSVFGGVS